METPVATQGLPSLVTALRHHVAALVSVVAVFVGLAVVYVLTATPLFTASAVLLLNPSAGNPLSPEETVSSTRMTVAMETERGLATTPTIADLTSDAIGREAPAAEESLQVSVPGGTQMLRFSFTSTTPERAREGAQAFAETFLAYREGRTRSNQSTRLEALGAQAEAVEESLQVAIAADGTAEEEAFASNSVDIFTGRLAQLNADISAVEVESTQPGSVITPAELATSPVGPNPNLVVIASGIAGLLLGILLALFLEWRRDLVREDDEFEVSGVPVFAKLPRRATPGLIARTQNGQLVDPNTHEAYRRLRAGVVANGPRPHVLGVAAVGEHEHASAVVANLAVVLSEARFSVLLIAADPRSRQLESLFEIPASPGLSDVVQDGRDPKEVLQTSSGIAVLAGGADAYGARELYAGQALRNVVDRFRAEYDYILIAASGTGTADGDAAIGAADSVLLSVTSSRTTHAQVTAALDRFARLNIVTLGAVNVPPASTDPQPEPAHSFRRRSPHTSETREGSRARIP
ncbi:Wzz/FepE/Etk N-terminal domain-containing protein [Ornithinimicrobium murale]|uniref:Wzz/FepE/Etk N-terminal domain-containing protein n=1 Tax=Ornithinimicrobium murale TaxID=1050153 RepID=UPI000E0D83D7|nr:Wzz/FepE/Etk N-terminal domain-containing protein [Ornithinimicrobium murale]